MGRSGLTVSRLALGTMTWGGATDSDDAAAQAEAFVEAGGTLIETANVYGDGAAEAALATVIPHVIPRHAVQLALTTVGATGRGSLLASLDTSLGRLGVDAVDLWMVHGFDADVPYQETCSALSTAVSSGRARYAGLSGHSAWQAATIATAQAQTDGTIVAAQTEFSLLARQADSDLLPAAAVHHYGLLGWGPLARGVLTGKYRSGTPADSRGAMSHYERYVAHHRTEHASAVVDAVSTAADGLGVAPLAVALAWARDRQGMTASVVGARTTAQLRGALAAEDLTLPDAIRTALDDVSATVTSPAV